MTAGIVLLVKRQDAAYSIVQHRQLLHIIKTLATGSIESIKSMAIGAINALSRSREAVPILEAADVVEDILLPILRQHEAAASRTANEAVQRHIMTATRLLAPFHSNHSIAINAHCVTHVDCQTHRIFSFAHLPRSICT